MKGGGIRTAGCPSYRLDGGCVRQGKEPGIVLRLVKVFRVIHLEGQVSDSSRIEYSSSLSTEARRTSGRIYKNESPGACPVGVAVHILSQERLCVCEKTNDRLQ